MESSLSIREKKPNTQHAVALACNLSRATVGKVLGGGKDALLFSQETRNRVWEAARQLGYRPNRAAQMMRKGRSNLIAIIYFNSSVEVGWRAAGFLPGEIKARGYDYLVFDYLWHGGSLDAILREVIQLRMEGVLLLGLPAGVFTSEHAQTLKACGISAVTLDIDETLAHTASVICDSRSAFRDLTSHLLGLGHRSILFPLVEGHSRANQERTEGFREGLSPAGSLEAQGGAAFLENWPAPARDEESKGWVVSLPCEEKRTGYSESVYRFCGHLFSTGDWPDAIMCSNDSGAIAVFMAAHEFGIKIPEDLAVTGYDDDELSAYPMFNLTTARQEVKESCLSAVETLMTLLQGKEPPVMQKVFRPTLILRGSCGRQTETAPLNSSPSLARKLNSSAFTLLELLVTVSIIAILATLLLSGTKSFLASGKAAACTANLRTLGTGFAMYAGENNNDFPNFAQGGYWPGRIAEYVPRKAFFCPVEDKRKVLQNIGVDKVWNENQPFISYGYNYRYLAPDFGSNWAVPRPREEIRYSKTSRLSQVMLLADAGRLNSDRKSGWGFYVMEPPTLDYSMPLPRHKGDANVLWADGSVSARKAILEKKDGYKYITERNWDWRLP